MTLQQKLLAKKSKKGFTLVELVVVIAILGILAAIAIPAVIGIINSAQASQRKSDAASIDSAANDFYASVVSGVVHAGNAGKLTDPTSPLPAATASASDRKTAAGDLTVKDALIYNGLDALLTKGKDFGYDGKGHIYSIDDGAHTVTAFGSDDMSDKKFSEMGFD